MNFASPFMGPQMHYLSSLFYAVQDYQEGSVEEGTQMSHSFTQSSKLDQFGRIYPEKRHERISVTSNYNGWFIIEKYRRSHIHQVTRKKAKTVTLNLKTLVLRSPLKRPAVPLPDMYP